MRDEDDESLAQPQPQELILVLRTLLVKGHCHELVLACEKGIAPGLAREGRRLLSDALGVPSSELGDRRHVERHRRPLSAGARGARCAALDRGLLAEVCCVLRLDREPWPSARTPCARAERLLAVVGALGRRMLHGTDESVEQATEWAVRHLAQLLASVGRQPKMRRVRPRPASVGRLDSRSHTGTLGMSLPASPLAVGDAVLAHWAAADGAQSSSVEDATVLGVSRDGRRVSLLFVDGMELEVPCSWVVQRCEPSVADHGHAEFVDSTLRRFEDLPPAVSGTPAYSVLHVAPADGADFTLQRLLQRGAPPAEVAARVVWLCNRPRGAGVVPLTAALTDLATAPQSAQQACVEALCALCRGAGEDAPAARAFANAVLLSGCHRLCCSSVQLRTLRGAAVLSQTQRRKLETLFQPPGHWHAVF